MTVGRKGAANEHTPSVASKPRFSEHGGRDRCWPTPDTTRHGGSPQGVMSAAGFDKMHSCGHVVGDHAAFRDPDTGGFPCHAYGCDCEGTDLE